jgi:tRNA-modifying protein YgfZ
MTVSPLLDLPAAVAADGPDEGVAGHYGNPIIEQRRLGEGSAVVDLSRRGVLTVTGADRLSWLDSLVSQDLARLEPGDSSEALLLDPSGRIEHAMHVLDDGETSWLIVEAAAAEPLRAWLDRMRFMLRVEVADRSEAFAVIGTMAADAGIPGSDLEAAAPAGVHLIWRDPWSAVARGGFQYAVDAEHPATSWRFAELIIARADLDRLHDEVLAGRVMLAGALALEALRIAAWRPRWATEVDEKAIPHELDWLRSAVHLAKGCYRGQETVAKVHNLGRPPRRLVMLHLDGSDTVLPGHGEVVFADKVRPETQAERRAVGVVTSSAIHHELGPIALALVKRAVPPDLTLFIESHGTQVAAAQVEVVPAGAGPSAAIPRLPRLGIRR